MAFKQTTLDFDKFDAEWFLSTYYTTLEGNEKEIKMIRFILDSVDDICKTGKIKGKRCLDVGSGPCIHSVISISEHVDEIHLSDFSRKNIQVLSNWKHNSKEIQKSIFEYLFKSNSERKTVDDFESEVRSKVTAIKMVDVRKYRIIADCNDSTYDVITSCLCLESAVATIDEYENAVNNITKHLNVNGYFVLSAVLEETFYLVGNLRFNALHLTEDQIIKIYKQSGYDIQVFKSLKDYNEDDTFSDFKGMFVMVARNHAQDKQF